MSFSNRVPQHHRIDVYGDHKMVLVDEKTGVAIAVAVRGSFGLPWKVETPNHTHTRMAKDRSTALDHLTEIALEVFPADGYATFVPHYKDHPDPDQRILLRDAP
jgi:hypothetical protein